MRKIAYQFGMHTQPILMALNVLDYLYREEIHDYQNSDYLKIRKFIIENFMDFPINEVPTRQLNELQVRFMARLAGYLTTIRQLEENLGEIFKSWTSYNTHRENEQIIIRDLIKEMKLEVENYYTWRDKVFGHLERHDNTLVRQEVRLQYGGHIIDVADEECLSLRPYQELKGFSRLNIVIQHKDLMQHYINWEELFTKYSHKSRFS